MRFNLKQMLIGAAILLAAVYGYDYLSVRHRMAGATQTDPFDVVTYPHVLAIPQKGNRVEYALDVQSPMESDPCVHSLLPHLGYTPCWYIRWRTRNPTPMMILFPAGRFVDRQKRG
jgi:hypothetical protein